MSHNSSISEMGEPVQEIAIRVINEKWLLLIIVGINISLSCVKEYVKFTWEFTCKPGRENLDFLQVKKIDMTQKEKNVCIEVLCILKRHWWKVRVGVSGFLTFKNIWHDLNYKNASNVLGFKLPKKYAYWICLFIRSCCWKNDMLSFQIKASHLHIGPKWLCQPEIGYTTLLFFQINTPTIRLTLHFSSTMVGRHEKQSESNTTSTSSTGSLHHLCKMSGLIHNMLG